MTAGQLPDGVHRTPAGTFTVNAAGTVVGGAHDGMSVVLVDPAELVALIVVGRTHGAVASTGPAYTPALDHPLAGLLHDVAASVSRGRFSR